MTYSLVLAKCLFCMFVQQCLCRMSVLHFRTACLYCLLAVWTVCLCRMYPKLGLYLFSIFLYRMSVPYCWLVTQFCTVVVPHVLCRIMYLMSVTCEYVCYTVLYRISYLMSVTCEYVCTACSVPYYYYVPYVCNVRICLYRMFCAVLCTLCL